MSNLIGWGQGSENNDIGWGQGAVNNDIGWGAIHELSYAGETNIVGSPIPAIVNAFKTRVIDDGGTFEAQQCLIDNLTILI
jgi:hypothetical protein